MNKKPENKDIRDSIHKEKYSLEDISKSIKDKANKAYKSEFINKNKVLNVILVLVGLYVLMIVVILIAIGVGWIFGVYE